jgi:hypothetical protein
VKAPIDRAPVNGSRSISPWTRKRDSFRNRTPFLESYIDIFSPLLKISSCVFPDYY